MGAGDKNIPTIAILDTSASITIPDDSNTFYLTCKTSAGANAAGFVGSVSGNAIMEGRVVTFIVQSASQSVQFSDVGPSATSGQFNLINFDRVITGGSSLSIRQSDDGSWTMAAFSGYAL